MFFDRQKRHADAVGARLGEFKTEGGTLTREKLMRNLEENSGAVSGLGIASASAAMRQVEQHLNSLADDVVTFAAADVGHKAYPAGFMLLRGMIQALGGGHSVRFFSTRRHGHFCGIFGGERGRFADRFFCDQFS